MCKDLITQQWKQRNLVDILVHEKNRLWSIPFYLVFTGNCKLFSTFRDSEEKLGKLKRRKQVDMIWTEQTVDINPFQRVSDPHGAPYWLKQTVFPVSQCYSTLKQVFHFLSTRAQSHLNTHTCKSHAPSQQCRQEEASRRQPCALDNKVRKQAVKLTG